MGSVAVNSVASHSAAEPRHAAESPGQRHQIQGPRSQAASQGKGETQGQSSPIRTPSRFRKRMPPRSRPRSTRRIATSGANSARTCRTSSPARWDRRLTTPCTTCAAAAGSGVGTNSPFGSQFGAYAGILRDRVEQNWHTTELNIQTAAPVAITFSILRNGALVPGSVKVSQSSGNRALDFSAQRAVLDAAPFPPLPPQYSKNQADIELRFELRR